MKHTPPVGPLFDRPPDIADKAPRPLGDTFDPVQDGERLGAQYVAVRDLMRDACWRTLGEVRAATGYPEASISARLRDMRRGGFVVQRRRRLGVGGTYEYRALRI